MSIACISMAVVLVAACAVPTIACTCGPAAAAPACEKLATSGVIFVGTVLSAEPDPQRSQVTRLRVYRFRVETAYKGLAAGTEEIIVNPDNFTSCQTRYLVGKRYLIFASPMAGTAEVLSSGCHGSRMADDATEDLDFLNRYRLSPSGNFVYGRVLQWAYRLAGFSREEEAPVGGAHVALSNASQVRTQLATGDGAFRFEDIPAGDYSLTAHLNPYQAPGEPIHIVVPAVGCIERFPVLEAITKVSGILVTKSGKPVPGMAVQILRRTPRGKWSYPFSKQTSTGNFNLSTFRKVTIC